jgi:hypothetical protein
MIYADDQYTFDFNMNSTPITTYPNITTISTGTISTGTLSTSLTGPTWTTSPYTINTVPSIMKVEVDAEFHGDVRIKGVNLSDRLDTIEERLGILRPNHDLEGRWEELKELGEQYRQLEKEILEKEHVWDLLKK